MHGFSALWRLIASDEATAATLLVVTGLFAWAGAYKLYRPLATATAISHFGLTRAVHRGLGRLAGAMELAVALALAAPATRRIGAVAAAVLGLAFVVMLTRALRRGEAFSCACLGANEPISRAGVWRAALTVLGAALVAAVQIRAASLETWMQAMTLAAVVVAVPLLVGANRRLGVMRRQLDDALEWQWIVQRAGEARGWVTR